MKKIIFILLIIVSIFLISCNNSKTQEKEKTIADTPIVTPTVTKTEEVTNVKIEIADTGKTNYLLGEELDLTGFTFKLTKSDGTSEIVSITADMVTVDMSKAGKVTCNVKYLGLEASFSITIEAIKPVELFVKETGKDYYWFEQTLDLSGYVFGCKYNNGEEKVISNEDILSDFVSFEENETDDPIDVSINISANIDGVILYTTITVHNYSEWIYEEMEIKKQDEETISYIESTVYDYIPSDVDYRTEKLTLIDSSDLPYKGYVVGWNSSETRIITPLGDVTPDEDDYDITLTLTLKRSGTILYTKEFKILVKGLGPVEFPPFDRTQRQVFAYSYNGNFLSLDDVSARKINFYNYCFANIGNDFTLTMGELTHLDEVLSYRRKYHIRVILSIKNGPWVDLASSDANLVKFSMSVVNAIERYHLDGIDIDWEFPPKDVGAPLFTKLISTLREYMDIYTPGKFLTAALIGGGSVSNVKQYYECDKANDILDYAHIMTYDLNSSETASHHTNPLAGRAYSAQSSIGYYHDAGFDYDKIVIGCAFYGKISELSSPYDKPTKAVLNSRVSSTTTLTYSSIKRNYLTDSSYEQFYDDKCGAYYLTNGKKFITYETPESIRTKGELVYRYGLGGLMFWDLGSDNTGELLSAVFSVISDINNGRM